VKRRGFRSSEFKVQSSGFRGGKGRGTVPRPVFTAGAPDPRVTCLLHLFTEEGGDSAPPTWGCTVSRRIWGAGRVFESPALCVGRVQGFRGSEFSGVQGRGTALGVPGVYSLREMRGGWPECCHPPRVSFRIPPRTTRKKSSTAPRFCLNFSNSDDDTRYDTQEGGSLSIGSASFHLPGSAEFLIPDPVPPSFWMPSSARDANGSAPSQPARAQPGDAPWGPKPTAGRQAFF